MKVGIIGVGSIGKRHVSNLLMMGHDVFGIDEKPDRHYEDIPVVDHEDDFWCYRPDAVFVCTPPASHHLWTKKAIVHGCHVFVEKPLAMNYLEAIDLVARASSADKILAVGYQLRFVIDGFQRWKFYDGLNVVHRQSWDRWPSRYQKDVLLEFSHEISSATYINGPARAVLAQCYGHTKWDICLEHVAASSRVIVDAGSTSAFERSIIAGDGTPMWGYRSPSNPINDRAYADEVLAFMTACQTGRWDERLCNGVEAAHVMQIIDACNVSANTAAPVRLHS